MKNILAWVKSNIIIVVSCLVILVALPVGFVFSNGWNKKIRTARETEAQDALSQVQKASVTYTLPAAMPGEQPMQVRAVPTAAMTEWFKQQRERVRGEVTSVIKTATAFNRRDRKPLIDGLFPKAQSKRDEDQKILDFVGILAGRPEENKPSAYQQLFERHGGGEPADAGKIADALRDLQQRTFDANGNRQLTAAESEALRTQLVDRRIGELRRRALEISFYVTPAALATSSSRERDNWSSFLLVRPSELPTLPDAFVQQWNFWLLEDLIAAVEAANTGPDGERLEVERAPVKRVVSVAARIPDGLYTAGIMPTRSSESESVEYSYPFENGVPLDKRRSFTGRHTNEENNKVYDVRIAELTVIVASDRIQSLLSALSQTNYMTVLDIDMESVDPWAELRQGYYYGSDHVVKATLTIESVWLRSWLTPFMPFAVANNLGAELPEEEAPEGE